MMKLSAIQWVFITTLLLVLVTVLVQLDHSFALILCLTLLGQIVLVVMVVKVLKDNYKTQKTFDNFYEDRLDLGK